MEYLVSNIKVHKITLHQGNKKKSLKDIKRERKEVVTHEF